MGEKATMIPVDDDDDSSSHCYESSSNSLPHLDTFHAEENKRLRQALEQMQAERDAALRTLTPPTTSAESAMAPEFSVRAAVEEIHQWMFTEEGHLLNAKEMLTQYSERLGKMGIPLDRLVVEGLQDDGTAAACVWTWEDGAECTEHQISSDRAQDTHSSSDEPFLVLRRTGDSTFRMTSSPDSAIPPNCQWFANDHYTDYLALPLIHYQKFQGAISWCTKAPQGFLPAHIDFFQQSLAALATVMRVHMYDRTTDLFAERLETAVKERTVTLTRANQELKAANQRIQQEAANQLQHFAMMSHEIRTPLNCVIGMSSVLESMELTEEMAESVDMIVQSGELLASVVNDVLDYSRLESGKMEIVLAPTSLPSIITTVVTAMEIKARARQVLIQTSQSPAVPRIVQSDGSRLQQILFNLLGNAIKFSEEASVVYLTVDMASEDTVQFVVRDTGRGIDEKKLNTIFEPFNQGDQKTEEVYGGTGLGLSITRKLVEGLGGTITANSVLGEWSEFIVLLPSGVEADRRSKLAREMSSQRYSFSTTREQARLVSRRQETVNPEEAKQERENELMGHLRVLVAEDNLVNQKIMKRILQRLGIARVDVVDNGKEAVDRESREAYDIVLMDMQMPVMSGVEASTRITSRADRGVKEAPKIVFVTAHALETHQKQAQEAGGCGFVSKPFNLQKIRTLLTSLFLEDA